MKRSLFVAAGLLAALVTVPAYAADAKAAEALARKSGCFKCHSVEKKKDGPSYQELAQKFKGKPDAEGKLYTHLTTKTKIKIDGKEDEHIQLKSTDDGEIRNVIQWVLSF